MATTQAYKDYGFMYTDKENNCLQSNIPPKRTNFLIKKNPKGIIKPLIRNVIQPSLDIVDAHLFNASKGTAFQQTAKEVAVLNNKKLNAAQKVKKSLNFEKDPLRKSSIEAHIIKEKQILAQKSRLIQPLKEANREILLPDIHRYNSHHLRAENVEAAVKQKRKISCDAQEVVSHHYEEQFAVLRRVPSEVVVEFTKEEIVNFRDQSTNTIRDYASDIIETLKEKDVIILSYSKFLNFV